MWDLSSMTKDRTHVPCIVRQILYHWTTREVPNIFSLYLIFDSLINMCLGVFLFGFILYGTLCASWTWLTVSFPTLGKFSTTISSNLFSGPFSFSSSSGTRIIQMLVCLMLFQRSLRLFSILFIVFCLFCSAVVSSTILSYRSLILFFCLSYSAIASV